MIKRFVDGMFRKVFRLPEPPPEIPDEPALAPIDASISRAGLEMLVNTDTSLLRPADEYVVPRQPIPAAPLSGSWADRVARARQQNRR